jgi:small subunit ribosomal protein S8e
MGITRDSRHKHRLTGGRVNVHKKKRKYEMGRPAAMTRLGHKRVRVVRCRGANLKFRALRLDQGNFSWGSENTTRKVRVMDVVYNSTNNELVRTKTLVKNTIVLIDATPFRQWYQKRYGVELGKKANRKSGAEVETEGKSGHLAATIKARNLKQKLDNAIEDQFNSGRLLACISSRPGQSGRVDGYVLEGEELHFYKRKMEKKKKA